MNQGKEASLVQREVAANAAGGIDEVPPLATCAAALSNQTGAEPFNGPYNPPCMAAPCCPPFAQGGLRSASAVKLRCRTRQVV